MRRQIKYRENTAVLLFARTDSAQILTDLLTWQLRGSVLTKLLLNEEK